MDNHYHLYAPGTSINKTPFLYCSCGNAVNCQRNPRTDGHNLLLFNAAAAQLQATIIRERELL